MDDIIERGAGAQWSGNAAPAPADEGLMIPSSSFAIDTSEVQRDLAELAGAIDEALTIYGDLLVTDETFASLDRKEIRRRELAVSRSIRTADEMRRKLNRDYKIPLDLAKKRYDELMGPVIELHGAYKQRRIEFEEREKTDKLEAIRRIYEGLAPQIALPSSNGAPAPVPFERILESHGSKWLNKGKELDEIETEVSTIVKLIASGERIIDESGLAHATEAKAVFWQTLDIDAALARDRELCAFEERQAALSAPASPAPPSDNGGTLTLDFDAAGAAPAERKPRVMLIEGATDEECRKIGEFCASLGIKGVFKGPAFYEAVKRLQPYRNETGKPA